MIETHLVDFRSLDADPSSARRNELMKGVASLFAFASERCSLEQIEIYNEVLTRLADMVEHEALAFAAQKIAPLRRAPEDVVRRFAGHDDIGVAGPVLRQSPVLNERDLIHVAANKGRDHLMAIAGRQNLSEGVTEAVVRRGDADVRRTIAGNHGAMIGEWSLSQIVEQAIVDEATARALGSRADTPDAVIAEIAERGVEGVRRALAERGLDRSEADLSEAARLASQRMSNAYWLGQYDFETAWEKLINQGGARIVSESLLMQYASEDRFADVTAVFAMITDLSLEEAKHWLVRPDTEPFVTISRALGLRMNTVQVLLRCGPWKHRLSAEERGAALAAFMDLDPRVARSRIAMWRETRLQA